MVDKCKVIELASTLATLLIKIQAIAETKMKNLQALFNKQVSYSVKSTYL